MDGKQLPRPQGGPRRAVGRKGAPGLQERDGYWHVNTTVRVKGESFRLRRSTGIPAGQANLESAEAIRDKWVQEIRDQVIHGVAPTVSLGVAARDYLNRPRERPLNAFDVSVVQELVRAFGLDPLAEISDKRWKSLVDMRHMGNQPQTRERWLNAAFAFLNWCADEKRKWLTRMPAIERLTPKEVDRLSRKAAQRRRVVDLRPELVALLIENAPWHYKPQLATIWTTGWRVSSILHGIRLCDVILAPGREQVTTHRTKNGEPVTAALHPYAADKIREYLERRGKLERREDPLFLTDRGLPYADVEGAWGGQNKTAFKAARRRTVRQLLGRHIEARKAGRSDEAKFHREDARLIYRLTQHWFRHALASTLNDRQVDLKTIMDQQGWKDPRSARRYIHGVEETRRRAIADLPMGDAVTGLPEVRRTESK